jgi:exodeoxyribonuclease-3
MNIVSWNVTGIRAIVKKDFFEAIENINPDILCLQETKAQKIEFKKAISPLSGYHAYASSADKKGYYGTALLSKTKPESLTNDMSIAEHDAQGHMQCAEYKNFYLVNVYVPNSGQQLDRLDYRKQWDADFLEYLKTLEKTKPIIACGDFNVAHHTRDLKNNKSNYNKTAGYTQVEIDGMDKFIDAGFVDAFRYFHPNKIAYTYWSYRFNAGARHTGLRIDYFLMSTTLLDKLKSVKLLSEYYDSDYRLIQLEIDV